MKYGVVLGTREGSEVLRSASRGRRKKARAIWAKIKRPTGWEPTLQGEDRPGRSADPFATERNEKKRLRVGRRRWEESARKKKLPVKRGEKTREIRGV